MKLLTVRVDRLVKADLKYLTVSALDNGQPFQFPLRYYPTWTSEHGTIIAWVDQLVKCSASTIGADYEPATISGCVTLGGCYIKDRRDEMLNAEDPFYKLYAANRNPDHATVQTQEGTAILCWLDDSGVLHLAKTMEKEGGRDDAGR